MSVQDSQDRSKGPLAGLTPWHFEMRLDGRRLQPGEDVSVDAICPDAYR
ncbi:MAG: hypothetical protein Q9Q13_14605 [Acidobacteriota bacterium]|nr:hypothetical protein [Acidobacteriota bacterium]